MVRFRKPKGMVEEKETHIKEGTTENTSIAKRDINKLEEGA